MSFYRKSDRTARRSIDGLFTFGRNQSEILFVPQNGRGKGHNATTCPLDQLSMGRQTIVFEYSLNNPNHSMRADSQERITYLDWSLYHFA